MFLQLTGSHPQVAQYAQDDGFLKLPSSLLVVLRSKRIHKLGVQVKADLTRLYNDCGFKNSSELPFLGALELGSMAKDRNVTDHARVSLSDLTALVLRRHLRKDPSLRVSTRWNDPELSSEQETYAALDVYAALAIYEAFSTIPSVGPVTSSTPAGTKVQLMSRVGGLVVAYGYIARHQPKQFDGVNVSKSRVVITVTSITVPAYLVRAELLSSHQDTPLSNLGSQLPFPLLCRLRDLRTSTGHHSNQLETPNTLCKTLQLTSSSSPQPTPSHPVADTPYHIDLETAAGLESELDMALAADDGDVSVSEQAVSDAEKDTDGLRHAASLADLVAFPQVVSIENTEIRSRVIGDIWHLMDQFKVSLHHGLRRPFSCALRDAIFLLDPEDRAAVEKVLETKNMSFRQMVLTNSDWIWQWVKRLVPPPEILAPRVTEVLQTYGPLKDAVTGQPLFNDVAWEKAHTVIENIKMGYYSDPPGYSFYALLRTDKYGLNVYRCSRGTNNVEGGIHQNIIRRFGSFNASPQLTVNLLRDYTLTHNLEVSMFHLLYCLARLSHPM